jgi:hypothetical protein
MCQSKEVLMAENQYKRKVKKEGHAGRGGRPRLGDEERRTVRINVPLNQEEKSVIIVKATTYRMSGAFFLRRLGLGHRMRRPLPAINIEAYRELGNMAVNLNQIVVLSSKGRESGITPEFAQQLYDLLQTTRRALMGVEDSDRQD